ncbi:hypothetical protein MNBD_CHLOROFLEXI01-776, partial [hydrothermal vent metagenome]
MFMHSKSRKTGFLLVLLSLALILLASAASANESRQTAVTNSRTKIHPNLLQDIDAALAGNPTANGPALAAKSATDGQLQFVARITAGADLSAYTTTWFARPFVDPLGTTVAAGFASPTAILKMAADPAVITLQRSESLVELPQPADPDVNAALNDDIVPALNLSGEASPGPAPEGWYSTGSAIHGSQAAWDKGYTGSGVRYMSNDSGADYCHPDLQGTWAYIDDASSPYYGLPEMFDSLSSYYAAFDYFVGTTLISDGLADYSDTSETAVGDFSYATLGAAAAHNYTVTGTSLSGEYHYGSHPDKALAAVANILSGSFGDGTAVSGERAAVLVVDENEAGVYDTVYVDVNFNYDFSDDAPARLTRDFANQETACLDYDADGLNDVSGGLVYFISDGETAVPTLDWYWGVPGSAYGNGDLVAFHVQDFTEGGGTHGQGTTSVAVGQGVVAGSVNWGPSGSPIAGFQGLVVGPGRDVSSTQNGDFYLTPFIEDAYVFAGLGYDGISGTGDDIQIVSNSWGFSGTDNDGFDFTSRLIDIVNRSFAPNTALLFSTGNGAAGYGTSAPPSPASGIGIGASTLFGTIGLFETIGTADQVVGGDVISWSNRGPGARNVTGVDVVATGAFGTGALSLNGVLWGAIATNNFGGTSMAAPVAAGNLALMYQAWYENYGQWPTFEEARTLIMNSATNTEHDVWSQGAGLVNADTGTDIAAGYRGLFVSPPEWSAGDYRGVEYGAFANIINPGERDVQTFTVTNTSDSSVLVRVTSETHVQIGSDDLSFTSLDQSLDHGSFTTPDYAFQVDPLIPTGTDLMMVRLTKPYDQFDPDGDLLAPYSNWRVHIQDWTDLDGDGLLWDDANGNGKVDLGETDAGEHVRFTYGYNAGPTQQARISNPLERMSDGIFVTLRHRNQVPEVPNTDLGLELSYWQLQNWDWARSTRSAFSLDPGDTRSFDVTLSVPDGTPYGMYQGSVTLDYGGDEVVIPVTVAVAASGTSFEFGQANAPDDRSAAILDVPMLYDNDTVFGYTDYTWRAESGDWRFFWTDVNGEELPQSGTSFLVVDNSWQGAGSDIDTIIMGPTEDCASNGVGCSGILGGYPGSAFYGPYTLSQVGRSNYGYVGSGRWLFDTSTGGSREIVA